MRSGAIPRRCSVAVNFTLYATSAAAMATCIEAARGRSNFIRQRPRSRPCLDPALNPVAATAPGGLTAPPDEMKDIEQWSRRLAAGLEIKDAPAACGLQHIARPEVPVLGPSGKDRPHRAVRRVLASLRHRGRAMRADRGPRAPTALVRIGVCLTGQRSDRFSQRHRRPEHVGRQLMPGAGLPGPDQHVERDVLR